MTPAPAPPKPPDPVEVNQLQQIFVQQTLVWIEHPGDIISRGQASIDDLLLESNVSNIPSSIGCLRP